jgi:CheY-like chemotaxis protein
MKILTVDDDKITRFLIRKILIHEFNAEVIEAENGFKALEILGNEPHPDLALLDMMMPGMDGIQLLERIRMNYALRRMKIIMCSAQNERLRIAQAYALEIQDYILKPIQPQKLGKAIKIALRLDDNHVPVKTVEIPRNTDLQVYMGQLSALVRQTDCHIQIIRKSSLNGDRSSVADSLRDIFQESRDLGITRMSGLAESLESEIYQCSEDAMAKGIQLLAEELVLLRQTISGVHPGVRLENA